MAEDLKNRLKDQKDSNLSLSTEKSSLSKQLADMEVRMQEASQSA